MSVLAKGCKQCGTYLFLCVQLQPWTHIPPSQPCGSADCRRFTFLLPTLLLRNLLRLSFIDLISKLLHCTLSSSSLGAALDVW